MLDAIYNGIRWYLRLACVWFDDLEQLILVIS